MNWRKTSLLILLTLLPWHSAVWFGMYHVRSIFWTFILYHFVCLLPAVIGGHRLWRAHTLPPTRRQMVVLTASVMLTVAVALIAYRYTGQTVVSRSHVIEALTERGFKASYLMPMAVYFIVVNAVLEELFWRGVILNGLEEVTKSWRRLGTAWTAITFAAWHYLVLRELLQPGWAELTVGGVLAMGVFTSWLYRKTQSIIVPILWHALVFDLAVIAIFAAMVLGS